MIGNRDRMYHRVPQKTHSLVSEIAIGWLIKSLDIEMHLSWKHVAFNCSY